MAKREREKKKTAFPLELTTLRICIHVLPSAQPHTTRWKIAAHLKTHSFLFSDVLVCTLFKKLQTRSINYKIILFPELNLFKRWFLTSANNIKKELVVIFAQNRFSQFYWLLLIAAFLPVGTVPPFKQTVLALMWKFLCTQLLLTRHNKYPSHWYFDHYGKFYKSYWL